MKYTKSFIKNNIVVNIATILVYVKGIILLPVLIKTMGTEFYGAYSLLVVFGGFVFGISSFGIGFRMTRYLPSAENISERKKLFFTPFWLHLTTLFLLTIILLVFWGQIRHFAFGKSPFISPLTLILFFFASILSHYSVNYFRFTNRMMLFSFVTTIQPYIFIGLVVLIMYTIKCISMDTLFNVNSVTILLCSAPLVYRLMKETGISLPVLRQKEILADLAFGLPIILNYVVDFLISSSDRFIIGSLLSVKEVGFYNPAYVLGSLLLFMPKALGVAVPPLMAHAHDNNDFSSLERILSYSIKTFVVVAFPFIIGCATFSKPILIFISNREIAENAGDLSKIIAVSMFFYGLSLIFQNVLFLKLKTKYIFGVNVLCALLSLSLNIILINIFHTIKIAAFTNLFCFLLSFALIGFKSMQLVPVKIDWLFCGKVAFAALFIAPFAYFNTRIHSPFTLVLLLITSSVTYFIVLFILRPLSKNEEEKMKKVAFAKLFKWRGLA